MFPSEVDLYAELHHAYEALYDRVETLLIADAALVVEQKHLVAYRAVEHERLVACRAAVYEIKKLRMLIHVHEGRESKTLE